MRILNSIQFWLVVPVFVVCFSLSCAQGGRKSGEGSKLIPILSENLPKFTSAEECRTCHARTFATWSQTGHAGAMVALIELGFEKNPQCISCHTLGYGGGGFKSITETPQFASVQCESCHGSAINHAGRKEYIEVSFSAEVCGACHSWELSPIYQEWSESGHGSPVANLTALPFFRDACLSCHSADYILAVNEKPTKGEVENGVSCQVCHDPHKETGFGAQLRFSKRELCAQCHMNHDDAPKNPNEPYPHPHQTQGNIYFGEGGYLLESVRNSFHSNEVEFPNACLDCHQAEAQINPETPHQYKTHSFAPRVPEACVRCHSGDSAISLLEQTQNSIHRRLDALYGYFDEESPNYIDPRDLSGQDFVNYNKARFNFDMVRSDKSLGVHNGNYTRALLDAAEEFIASIER